MVCEISVELNSSQATPVYLEQYWKTLDSYKMLQGVNWQDQGIPYCTMQNHSLSVSVVVVKWMIYSISGCWWTRMVYWSTVVSGVTRGAWYLTEQWTQNWSRYQCQYTSTGTNVNCFTNGGTTIILLLPTCLQRSRDTDRLPAIRLDLSIMDGHIWARYLFHSWSAYKSSGVSANAYNYFYNNAFVGEMRMLINSSGYMHVSMVGIIKETMADAKFSIIQKLLPIHWHVRCYQWRERFSKQYAAEHLFEWEYGIL